jgi:nondiscriminating aspartyl-tRNA synthetase
MDTPEYASAKAAAEAQGQKVRAMKAKDSGATKEDIDHAVAELKRLKAVVEGIAPSAPAGGGAAGGAGAGKKDDAAAAAAAAKAREEEKELMRKAMSEDMTAAFKAMTLEGDANFGIAPMVQSQEPRANRVYTAVSALGASLAGTKVLVRARLHTSRGKGNSAFLVLRQQLETVQCALFSSEGGVTKQAIKWCAAIPRDSIVDVEAVVNTVPKPVQGCSITDVELVPTSVKVVSVAALLPFNIDDASRAVVAGANDMATVGVEMRLDNRWVDLRTPANIAIFRVQSAIGTLFREYLLKQSFVEIHSPKIISGASESGASVFKLGYFGKDAFLAQSPQLYKQMAICADFGRVFEVGPVFRAENSNTHRHLCEFMGLDLEMEIKESYKEVLEVFGELLVYVFDGVKERFSRELEIISQQYPFTPLVYPKKPLIISFAEGIQMLKDSGAPGAENLDPFTADIDTPSEKALGKLVKAKYNTDFYMMDRYPSCVRPFYTMPCPDDPRLSNSYDFFLRGEEILSGAQRIHDPDMLANRCKELGVTGVDDYINAFRHGAPAHGGGGLGLERLVLFMCGLDNIRKASLFPRDPQRFRP